MYPLSGLCYSIWAFIFFAKSAFETSLNSFIKFKFLRRCFDIELEIKLANTLFSNYSPIDIFPILFLKENLTFWLGLITEHFLWTTIYLFVNLFLVFASIRSTGILANVKVFCIFLFLFCVSNLFYASVDFLETKPSIWFNFWSILETICFLAFVCDFLNVVDLNIQMKNWLLSLKEHLKNQKLNEKYSTKCRVEVFK